MIAQAPEDFPAIESVSINPSVLAYAVLASLIAVVASGVYPAISATRIKATGALVGAMRGVTGPRTSRLSTVLIGVQVALAVVVTVGSGLTLRSRTELLSVDPGLDGTGVITVRPNPPSGRYPDGVAFREYYDKVVERIASLPRVESVGAIQLLPGTRGNWSFPTYPDGVESPMAKLFPA